MKDIIVLKGQVVYAESHDKLTVRPDAYLVAEDGKVVGVYDALPDAYAGVRVEDCGDRLIVPGFNDLHVHAPQFPNRGLGMDRELLPWLNAYTFPEEAKFGDEGYAKRVYGRFVRELWRVGTMRAAVFATIHAPSARVLADLMEAAGLGGYVGKVNMDRNSPDTLIEPTAASLAETVRFVESFGSGAGRVRPILTPRFVPTCTEELMRGLGRLAEERKLPVQSHLSENEGEIAWVRELHPESRDYASVYDAFGLFGQTPTVMAHCVHVTDDEIALMKRRGVYVAHCPISNLNLSSGIAPVRRFLEEGVSVGLGSDVSGGHRLSIMDTMASAVECSKMRWKYVDGRAPLTTAEVFYCATKGGGSFFGRVGSFESGYALDCLVIDDTRLKDEVRRSLEERLERFIYLGDDREIVARYVDGALLPEPKVP